MAIPEVVGERGAIEGFMELVEGVPDKILVINEVPRFFDIPPGVTVAQAEQYRCVYWNVQGEYDLIVARVPVFAGGIEYQGFEAKAFTRELLGDMKGHLSSRGRARIVVPCEADEKFVEQCIADYGWVTIDTQLRMGTRIWDTVYTVRDKTIYEQEVVGVTGEKHSPPKESAASMVWWANIKTWAQARLGLFE